MRPIIQLHANTVSNCEDRFKVGHCKMVIYLFDNPFGTYNDYVQMAKSLMINYFNEKAFDALY